MIKWWAYIHQNGSLQVKRYFSDLDLEDADISPFVAKVFKPIETNSREEAVEYFRNKMKGE